ncbi:unnamed protein product [Paramecium primaurelia]|uniref:Tetratricopeptide repeat protein n=1 Tax=Paramecium primaurelia TaxID=5886 RepID=A0A8S1LJX8_PARPR|nr:unnamed protein product [Paramecium primaurelia]
MSIQKKTSKIIRQSSEPQKYQNMYYEVQLPYFNPSSNSIFANQLLNNPSFMNIYQLGISSYLQGQYKQAIFFAEKLLCLNQDQNTQAYLVFMLGICHFANAEYSGVYNLFLKYKLTQGDFAVLAARALYANKQYELGIEILQDEITSQSDWIRGQCYEALENKQLAVSNYYECLQKTPTNVRVFQQLVDSYLISSDEKENLIQQIQLNSDEGWLKDYYVSKTINCDIGNQKIVDHLQEEKRKIAQQLQIVDKVDIQQMKPSPIRSPYIRKEENSIQNDLVYVTLDRKNNIDILNVKAKKAYYSYDIASAYDWSLKAIKQDPLYFDVIPTYVSCLLELDQIAELYFCAHNLIENYSSNALSWFVVGVYYFSTKKYEVARKQFQKSIQLNQHLIYSWIGLAHSYAIQDESDQAMSIYRSITRQFPGCYQAHVYIGMEYLRTNNLQTAILSLQQAKDINPTDPMIQNELGVIAYKQKKYNEAKDYFLNALVFCQNSNHKIRESALQNLGHTFRKQRDYKNAIQIFEKCIQLNSVSPQIFFGLAFSYHLSELPNSLSKAIHFYHKSLSLKSDQTFVQDMLSKALQEAADFGLQEYVN